MALFVQFRGDAEIDQCLERIFPRLERFMSSYERETVGLLKIGPCPFSPYVGVGHAEPHPGDVFALEHKIHQRSRSLLAREAARLKSQPT
jgi:hypothetical protein